MPTHTTCIPQHTNIPMGITLTPNNTNDIQNYKQYTTYYPTPKQPVMDQETTNIPCTAYHIPTINITVTTTLPSVTHMHENWRFDQIPNDSSDMNTQRHQQNVKPATRVYN